MPELLLALVGAVLYGLVMLAIGWFAGRSFEQYKQAKREGHRE